MSSSRHLCLVLAVAAALCLAAPLSAGAATTRYASPDGTGASPCLQTAPCPIETALSNAGPEGLANGDTVLLAPGTYHPSAQLNVFRVNVTISGEPGKAPPLIEAGGERGLLDQNLATVRDLRIHSPATTTYGLALTRTGTVVERVESIGEAAQACSFNDLTARDTLCATTAGGGTGIASTFAVGIPIMQELSLFNVTAIGTLGIDVVTNESATIKVDAVNTIFHGSEFDIAAERQAPPTSNVEISLSHSNFATTSTAGGAAVTLPTVAGNQTAPPLFVDEAAGDYREQATSPTRLAGDLGVVLPGELDLAGNARTANCAGTVGIDIGAYQYECPAPEPPVVPPTVVPKEEPKPLPPTCACVGEGSARPSLKHLALKPAKFTDAGKAPRGTTISYHLSEAASVKLEVLDKKRVKGKTKAVVVGIVPGAGGTAGKNSVGFNGRLKGKPLEPGKYTLRGVATAGGVSSAPATAGFEVRIP